MTDDDVTQDGKLGDFRTAGESGSLPDPSARSSSISDVNDSVIQGKARTDRGNQSASKTSSSKPVGKSGAKTGSAKSSGKGSTSKSGGSKSSNKTGKG